ncbi:hypothetical protein [Idiomarina fontislapidosi]|uniref:hypothetical protein n=1 Tax=Idiomarina fontislapidosi TaxID=263723 RepID=UPI0015E8C702|nr:hypothetical protein [Idiomarina fontislapidosi]
MGLKPGPKPIAKSTGKPDQRPRDNKKTPSNTPGLPYIFDAFRLLAKPTIQLQQ